MNKRGQLVAGAGAWFWIILGSVLMIFLVWYASSIIGGIGSLIKESQNVVSVSEVIPGFGFLDFIVGGVPIKAIDVLKPVPAFVINLVVFIMCLLMFGDVLSRFGAFSKPVSWALGVLLAVLLANIKLIALVSVVAFSLVATVGVLSVTVGLITPFVIFAIANFMILRPIVDWFANKRKAKTVTSNVGDVKAALKGMRDLGRELQKA